jgi:hypothetical protein
MEGGNPRGSEEQFILPQVIIGDTAASRSRSDCTIARLVEGARRVGSE